MQWRLVAGGAGGGEEKWEVGAVEAGAWREGGGGRAEGGLEAAKTQLLPTTYDVVLRVTAIFM